MVSNYAEHEQCTLIDGIPDIPFLTIFDPAQKMVTNHWHENIELMYVLAGSMSVNIEGNMFHLQADDCIIINSRVVHSVSSSPDNQFILIELPYEWLNKYIAGLDKICFSIDNHSDNPEYSQCVRSIKNHIIAMQALTDTTGDGWIFKFMSHLFELLSLLYTNCSTVMSEKNYKSMQKKFLHLNPVIDYVNDNYMKPITSRDAAALVHLQPQYFCRYFRRHMGKTFTDYLNEVRNYKIYDEIIHTDKAIGDIILDCGYTNATFFRQKFTAQFGCSPRALRKRQAT